MQLLKWEVKLSESEGKAASMESGQGGQGLYLRSYLHREDSEIAAMQELVTSLMGKAMVLHRYNENSDQEEQRGSE